MDLIAEIGGQLEIKSVVSRSAMDKLNPSTVLQKPRHNGVRHGWGTVGIEDTEHTIRLVQQRKPSVRDVLTVNEIEFRRAHIHV